ncbi:hypothetical protein Q4I30_001149 [Leishmania utingensis]|uniref:Proteophosphoglycan ppg4 n=1 Tax=Leishmania utingensis TaxID=653362 RepID=A0AAW3AWZ7_9TRYP
MGGACSRSKTKSAKHNQDSATGADASRNNGGSPEAPVADAMPSASSNPQYPISDHNSEVDGLPRPLGGDSFTCSTSGEPRNSNTSGDLSKNSGFISTKAPSRESAAKANNVVTAMSSITPVSPSMKNGGASSSPVKGGLGYEAYFPPGHDTGMRLGAGKYTGVGESSLSGLSSSDMQSLASTPFYNAEMRKQLDQAPHRGTGLPLPNPMIFSDDDTSIVETGSSAFATPRELQKGSSSVAGFTDNASIISRGSMTSQQPHGYMYYNSSTVDANNFPVPSSVSRPPFVATVSLTPTAALLNNSQRQQFQQQPQAFFPTPSATRVARNARTNRQVPASFSFGGASTPLTRQSSIAGSDRFQTCRSYTEQGSSVAGYLPPSTPLGAPAEADARFSSGYPASNAGGVPSTGRPLYTCRSTYTPVTNSLLVPSPAAAASDPAHQMTLTYSHNRERLSTVPDVSLLPLFSPQRTSSGAAALNTQHAQQLYERRQASLCSGSMDVPASEAFSVPPSSREFLDAPSIAASASADWIDIDRGFTNTAAAANISHQSTAISLTGSVGAATKPGKGETSDVSSLEPNGSSFLDKAAAPSSLVDAPELPKTRLPGEQEVKSAPAEAGGKAANQSDSNGSSSGSRSGARPRKPLYKRSDDFSPNPNPPLQTKLVISTGADAAVATTSKVHPSSLPTVAASTVTLADSQGVNANLAFSSATSKTSAEEFGAPDDSTAARGGRPTQPYIEAPLTPPGAAAAAAPAAAAAGGGNTVESLISPSASMESFAMVLLPHQRDYAVAGSSRGSWELPQPQESNVTSRRGPLSSLGPGGAAPKKRSRRASAAFRSATAHKGKTNRAPATTATKGAGAAAGPASASALVPLIENPKPWVPGGAAMATPVATPKTARGMTHRSSLSRSGSTPKKSGSRTRAVTTPGHKEAGARPASGATVAAARRSRGGAANPDPGRKARRQTQASSSVSRPSATSVCNPKAKRTAKVQASPKKLPLAPPTDTLAPAAATDREPPDAEEAESIVEYALCIGDAMEREEAGVNPLPNNDDANISGLQRAAVAPFQRQLQPEHVSRPNDSVGVNDIEAGLLAQEHLPQLHDSSVEDADQPPLVGFRASPEVSNATAITSAAESAFLQPYTEAQLAAQSYLIASGLQDDDEHQHPISEDDRAAIAAASGEAVTRQTVYSSNSDEQGPYSVSTASGEEVAVVATSSSVMWSNAGSPLTKYDSRLPLAEEDVMPAGAVVSNGDAMCMAPADHSAEELSSRSVSSGSPTRTPRSCR